MIVRSWLPTDTLRPYSFVGKVLWGRKCLWIDHEAKTITGHVWYFTLKGAQTLTMLYLRMHKPLPYARLFIIGRPVSRARHDIGILGQ
jgi:hypothetical protein